MQLLEVCNENDRLAEVVSILKMEGFKVSVRAQETQVVQSNHNCYFILLYMITIHT